jgi:hypothetical protein
MSRNPKQAKLITEVTRSADELLLRVVSFQEKRKLADLEKGLMGWVFFFAKFARFLVDPRDGNPTALVCRLHSCTEVPACTRYVAF